jgi:flagellar biosynthesis protein FlhB
MASEDTDLEKTEDPTQRRLDDARERGQILTSQEAFVFAALGAGTAVLALGMAALPDLAARWAGLLRFDASAADLILPRLSQVWLILLVGGLAAAVPVVVSVLAVQAALGGLRLAPKALGFKPDKLNPLTGMKRLVSAQSGINLLKSLAKVGMLGFVAQGLLMGWLPDFLALGDAGAASATVMMGRQIVTMLGLLSIGLAVIAAADILWQSHSRMASLRMTKDEVKREYKEQNGSPELKGKIRQKQMSAARRMARQSASVAQVPTATAVITNPQHFAVALRYVPSEQAAPVIVAMGKDAVAAQIVARARGAAIHTLQIPPLARALYFSGDIGAEIDERLFPVVAAVLAYVFRLDRGEQADLPDIDLPPDMRRDSHGRPEQP